MPVKCSKKQGYVEILNSDILSISGRLSDFPTAEYVRLDFYEENAGRVREIVGAFRKDVPISGGGLTNGLYKRGIK